MSVLEREALEASPLADLHAIASELGIDGYRRLRKAELIDALLSPREHSSAAERSDEDGDVGSRPSRETQVSAEIDDTTSETRGRRRSRRGGRGRSGRAAEASESGEDAAPDEAREPRALAADDTAQSEEREDGRIVVGVVELIPGGSGFLRVLPGETSDDDVYVSAAQVKRCELVNGDRVSGPRRVARRSERYASLIRVDTINGLPATEIAEGPRYDELPASFPSVALPFGGDFPALAAVLGLAPFGRGSRVTITGPARSGKSRLLRTIADSLAPGADREGVHLLVVLAGIRPEEIADWSAAEREQSKAAGFGASTDSHDQAVELVIDQAKRIAARGGNAVVLLDTLDALHPHVARKVMAAARQITDGGSLTLVATAARPIGGETTVVALDYPRTAAGEFPALDAVASGTLRPELLVGEEGAAALARARGFAG